MKRFFLAAAVLSALLMGAPLDLHAEPDQYMGDSSIYVGVPQDVGTPNVLFIIDNSSATLNQAVGAPYEPFVRAVNEDGTPGAFTDVRRIYPNPADPNDDGFTDDAYGPDIDPWDIYRVDQQGDFSLITVQNSEDDLENLSCMAVNNNGTPDDTSDDAEIDLVRGTLLAFGTYTGSGTEIRPSLSVTGNGNCNTNGLGGVYALGNYLRYIISGGGTTEINCDPKPVVEACRTTGSSTTCGLFELTQTFAVTDSDNCNPALPSCNSPYWTQINAIALDENGDPVTTATPWATAGNGTFDHDDDPVTAEVAAWVLPDCWGQIVGTSQREIVFNALKTVVGGAAGAVKIGAMVYDAVGQKGGKIVAHVADLSVNLPTTEIADGSFEIVPPDCKTTGLGTPFCDFFGAIPGPDRNEDGDFNDNTVVGLSAAELLAFPADYFPYGPDGYRMLASQTARPQAETLYDAGYYFGAFSDSISATMTRIPEAVENVCKLNHIILITNGLSNTDTDPLIATNVGDADGDGYPNEDVYGLGSHWLDDVTKYLNNFHEITTHTVLAFQSDDPLVRNAAKDGGGKYYNVQTAEELSRRLTELLANIVNEKDTSFVAPVVPASTTNRTVSSNRVYLGLFKPQEVGHWHGNIKKYGFDISSNMLTEPPADGSGLDFGDPAVDIYGNFNPNSVSYWSIQDGLIPKAGGTIDPNNADPNAVTGDGGIVDAGGVGGLLLKQVQSNSSFMKTGSGTLDGRNIFTFLPNGTGGWTKTPLITYTRSGSSISLSSDLINYDSISGTYQSPLLGLPPTDPSELSWYSGLGYLGQFNDMYRMWDMLIYLHGYDSLDVGISESGWDARDWVLADVLHSRPVVFNYRDYTVAEENVCQDQDGLSGTDDDDAYNSSVIFVGTNDGLFHAFRDCDGRELWAFAPDSILADLKYLPELEHTSYVDSAPAIYYHDVDSDGAIDPSDGDKVVIIFGQRRGGGKNTLDTTSERGAYYALDITDPTNPNMLWKFAVDEQTDGFGRLAETWALPAIKFVKVPSVSYVDSTADPNPNDAVAPNENAIRVLAFIPAGYDNNEDLRYGSTQSFPTTTSGITDINEAPSGGTIDGSGAALTSPGGDADGYAMRGKGVLALEVAYLSRSSAADSFTSVVSPSTRSSIGKVFWHYSSGMNYPVAADIRALDMNNNGGYIDRLYVGDTGGNLWRFNTEPLHKERWSGEIIFKSNSSDTSVNSSADLGRKIFYPPSVAKDGNMAYVCFATGDREHPLNLAVTDRLYCIKDFGQTTSDAIDEGKLLDVTFNNLQLDSTAQEEVDSMINTLYSQPPLSGNGYDLSGTDINYGWYIKLDGTDRDVSGEPGEKALAEPVIFQDEVFFSTYQLKTGARSGCEAGNLGISRLYRVDAKTGEAVYNYDLSNDDIGSPESLNERAAGEDGAVLRRSDRVYNLGEGIPSGVVQVVDNTGRVGLLISSSDKVEGIGGSNAAVTFPLYWIQWSD